MKYSLPKLIGVINSKNPNWTEERINWFIDSVRDNTGTNYNTLTGADRRAISRLSDDGLESHVGSLLSETISNNANKASKQLELEAQQIMAEADNYSQQIQHDANNSAQQIIAGAETSIEQLLKEANVEAQQIRDDAHAESIAYLSDLNAVRVVEMYTKQLPAERILMNIPKTRLLDYAQMIGCDVNDEMNKQDIVDTISNNYDGLGKEVIVVPDRSEQINHINQQKMKLGILENDMGAREMKLDAFEDELNDLDSRLKSDQSEHEKNKRLKLAQRIGYVMAGATLAVGAAFGEYTGITDFVDWTHLRG